MNTQVGFARVRRTAQVHMPTKHGSFVAIGYENCDTGDSEHLALICGTVCNVQGVFVRIHSECLTGEVLGSLRCDCGAQLNASLDAIYKAGRGILIYLRGHEGRGIGIMHKIRAYQLQDAGRDTVDANLALGLPVDSREYGVAAEILIDLGVRSVQLLSNNPDKQLALERHGIIVESRIPLVVGITQENLEYLKTKRDRMGHRLYNLPDTATDNACE